MSAHFTLSVDSFTEKKDELQSHNNHVAGVTLGENFVVLVL